MSTASRNFTRLQLEKADELCSLDLISVVVVNHNGRGFLAACLDSLLQQRHSPLEIILVDNASSDNSVDWVRHHYPDVRVIALERNIGFAGGCNEGIRTARGGYIATLNNDARPEPTWLDELMRVARDQPDIGMVASKMLFEHAPSVIDSAGICVDRAAFAWDRHGGRLDQLDDKEQDVFGACAGAALYRRKLFDDVGMFDEEFFCYLEDVDLAWRAQLVGWRCVYAPRARVYHRHSATAIEHSPFKLYHLGRNKVWLIAKNYPSPAVWFYLPIIVTYDVASAAKSIFVRQTGRGAARDRLAGLRGRIDGLAGIRHALAKRRSLQKNRRTNPRRVLSTMHPLASPWEVAHRYSHLLRPPRIMNLSDQDVP